MITRSKQDWTVGATVKVGFLSLTVVAAVATPGDYAPDAYILANKAGTQLYKFVPHNGVEKISADEARELVAEAKAHAAREAARAIKKASAHATTFAAIQELIAA
jgi:catalase